MIKIIKHGTKKTCTCDTCGCVFSYEDEDINHKRENILKNFTEYVECPQCNAKIDVAEVHIR